MASTTFFAQPDYVNPTADATRDSFARLRVTSPVTLFDSKQLVDNQPLFWDDQQVSGTATSTYDSSKVCSTLAVSNLTAGRRVRQTFQRFPYQPGKSHSIIMTGMLGTAAPGVVKRIGYFDDNNGVFFQAAEGKAMVVIRKASVDTVIPQDNWIFDPMDGTGKSHITLDLTKVQIFKFDFEWLGAGSVRFSFITNGQEYIIHRQDCGNVLASVYMLSPNLPLRYELINTGTGPAASMDCICSTVASEGGFADTGVTMSTDRGTSEFPGGNNTNLYALLGLRLKTAYYMAAITPLSISLLGESTAVVRWCLLFNPTIAGAAVTWADITNSALQVANATVVGNTVSGGTQLASGYDSQQHGTTGGIQLDINNTLRLGTSIAGVSDQLWLCAQVVNAVANLYVPAITWREQI